MRSNPLSPRTPDARSLKIVGLAMAGGVVAVAGVAIAFSLGREAPPSPPTPLAWGLCAGAVVALAAGWALPTERPARRLAALAMREAAGLIGSLATFVTGSSTWAAALGLLSVASILAGVAAVPSEPRHDGGPRLG
jgi:hypothetical protein